MTAKERGILLSGEMVRAILDGRKTQTRRIVKLPKYATYDNASVTTWDERASRLSYGKPDISDETLEYILGHRIEGQVLVCNLVDDIGIHVARCPYGQPGDRLWVRETFWDHGDTPFGDPCTRDERIEYRATPWDRVSQEDVGGWKPSIHMPRWASRITLEITDVRVERLRKISESDAMAEGVSESKTVQMNDGAPCYSLPFQLLWNSLHGIGATGWDANPWIWALTFKRIDYAK